MSGKPSWMQKNKVEGVEEEPMARRFPSAYIPTGNPQPVYFMPPNANFIQQQYAAKKQTYKELSFFEKMRLGGLFGGSKLPHEYNNPGVLAAGSVVKHGGIIMMNGCTIAIFPEDMPEMEDCFYAAMGIIHALFAALFISLGIAALITKCHYRFTLGGIWCAAPVIASSVFSIKVAKHETRSNVKKLVLCVVLAIPASLALTGISYAAGMVDGVYYQWNDIKDDEMFKSRNAVDGVGIVAGVIEAALCLGHLASLISNLKEELMYRCCSRKRFLKHLKEEAKHQEEGEERHLQKKKEMMQKLILDLEEEERYKEKWRRQQQKLLNKKKKEQEDWDEGGGV